MQFELFNPACYTQKRTFAENFMFGREAEVLVLAILTRLGYRVTETGQIVPDANYRGPVIKALSGNIRITDLFIYRDRICRWGEVKHKSGCAWNRTHGCWVAGIDISKYEDYLRAQDGSGLAVWLFFVSEGMHTKDCPYLHSPAGVFGNDLRKLARCELQRSDKSGMVYWRLEHLLPVDRRAVASFTEWGIGKYAAPAQLVVEQPDWEPLLLEGF